MKILRTVLLAFSLLSLSLAAAGCSRSHHGDHHCNRAGCNCEHGHAGGEAPATAAPAAAEAPAATDAPAATPTE